MNEKRWVLKNEKGLALTIALLVLLVLSLAGVAIVNVINTDLRIARNFKTERSAFFAAEAGLEEARLRLRGKNADDNYAGDPNPVDYNWSAYISTTASWTSADDPEYIGALDNTFPVPGGSHTTAAVTANSLQTDIPYFVRIRYKYEYDAEQSGHTVANPHYYDGDGSTAVHTAAAPGNIIYYGYGNPAAPTTMTQYTTAAAADYRPVEVIHAYGNDGDSYESQLQVEIVHSPGPLITAALYAEGDVTGNGAALVIDGTDACGETADRPPVYTTTGSTTTLVGGPTLGGTPATPVVGPDVADIQAFINDMKPSIDTTVTVDQTGVNYGTAANYVTVYSNTANPFNVSGLKLTNVTGYGTLLVEGDLTLGGGFTWNGLILCTGTITFNGGGPHSINVNGAVLANQTIDINGGIDVFYNSCRIADALEVQGVSVATWRQID